MNEQKIQELLKSLFDLKYNWSSSSGERYTSDVISKEARSSVETIIREFLLKNRDAQKGEMEAKLYAYEQIISKSNFAPFLNEKNDSHENTGAN